MLHKVTVTVSLVLLLACLSQGEENIIAGGSQKSPISLKFLDSIKDTAFKIEELFKECDQITQPSEKCNQCPCEKRQKALAYVDVIVTMVKNVKKNYYMNHKDWDKNFLEDDLPDGPQRNPEDGQQKVVSEVKFQLKPLPEDCMDALRRGFNQSGIYTIKLTHPEAGGRILDVYCDMKTDGGGWTVIQRRDNYTEQEDFNRGWVDYKEGFGVITRDFWLGNDNIYFLTNRLEEQKVRFDLEDVQKEARVATYENFRIEDESNGYRLHISGFNGTIGDAMQLSNGMMYSTIDRDNDEWKEDSCARENDSAFWYNSCYHANLNGVYDAGKSLLKQPWSTPLKYVMWIPWKGAECLKFVEIKLRGELGP